MTMTKYILYIAVALILVRPSLAAAQDGLLEPRGSSTIDTLKPDGVLKSEEEIKKKEFLNKFYDRCMEKPDKHQSIESQGDMCICETLHMEKHFTADEIEIMATGQGKGFVRKEILFKDVYAPCLEFPARAIALYECYNNPKVQSMVSTQNAYEGTCQCTANKAAEYFREYAKPQIAAIIKRSPLMEDPLGDILKSFEYRDYIHKQENKCLETYQVKWEDYYRKLQTQEREKNVYDYQR